jgi:hypothetical protein
LERNLLEVREESERFKRYENLVKMERWTQKGYNPKNLDLIKDKVVVQTDELGHIVDNIDEVVSLYGLQKDLSKMVNSDIVNVYMPNQSEGVVESTKYNFIKNKFVTKT